MLGIHLSPVANVVISSVSKGMPLYSNRIRSSYPNSYCFAVPGTRPSRSSGVPGGDRRNDKGRERSDFSSTLSRTEGFDRIGARRLAGGPEAENDADARRE